MATNDVTTAIKFLKKTYPFKDAEALSKVEDQNVQGILNFQNGIQLFGIDVKIQKEEESENFIITFGDKNATEQDLLKGYKTELATILESKGIKTSENDDLYSLIRKVWNLVNPNIYEAKDSIYYSVKGDIPICMLNSDILIVEEDRNE